MGSTIDDLQIKLQGDSKSANKEIDTVIKNLQNLSTALGGFKSVPGLQSVTKAFNEMKTATNGIDAGKIKSISSSIRSLASSIVSLQSVSSKGFGLNRLKEDVKGLESIKFDASGLSGITNLANSVSKIGSKSGTTATANLIPLADNLKRFVTEMNGMQASTFDAESLSRLASSISKIGGIKVTNATTTLPQLTSSLKTFVTEMNKVEGVSFNTEGLSNLTNSISRLGTKTSTVAVENIPKLQVAIKNLLTDLSKAPAISDNTVRSLEAMANIAQRAGGSFNSANNGITGFANKTVGNFDKIKNAASKIISAFGKVAVAAGKVTGINRLVNGIRSLIPVTNKAQTGFKGLAQKIGMLYASSFLVSRGFSHLKSAVSSAMDYVEEYDYFKNTFNEIAKNADLSQWKELGYKSAEEYANSFRERAEKVTSLMTGYSVDENGALFETGERNLGLNPSEVMHAQALFGQMSNSMGVATETASKLSRVYTKLGADMASAFNMDFAQVYENLQSGMTGMSRAVDKYGVNIRNAAMQEELHRLGIDASITKLSQQDKVLLRTIITLNSTKQAWGNLAQTISSPSNQIRLLTQNFEMLSQMLGSLFLPIVSKVLPYINALVIAFKSLVSYVGGLLGIDLSDYMKGISAGGDNESLSAAYDDADSLADSLDNAGDSAEKAAKKQKKFNKQLQGFDELNNLTTSESEKNPKGSSASSSGTPNVGADLTAALDDAISKYEEAWKKAFDGMENDANNIAERIKKAFVKAWKSENGYELGKKVASFVSKGLKWVIDNQDNFEKKFKKIAKIIATGINGAIWNLEWDDLGKAIGGSIKAYLEGEATFFKKVDWERLGTGLADSLNSFIDSGVFISYFDGIGAKARAAIETLFGFSEGFDFKNLGEQIGKGLNKILGNMNKKIKGLTGWQKLGKAISNMIKGTLDAATTFLKTFKWKKLGKGISDAIKSVDFKGIAIRLTNFTVAIFNAITEFLKGVDWFGVGQKIGEFIGNIDWVKIVINFADLAWNIVKAIGAAIAGIVSTAPIETGLIALIGLAKWAGVGKALFGGLASKIASSLGLSIAGSETAGITAGIKALITGAATPALIGAIALGAITLTWKWVGEGTGADVIEEDISKVNDKFKELQESANALDTALNNSKNALGTLNLKNGFQDAKNAGKTISTLADEYYKLSEKAKKAGGATNLTELEQRKLKEMSQQLIKQCPELEGKINLTTGAYLGTEKQLKKTIKQLEKYYLLQAAQEDLQNLYKQQYENDKALKDANKSLKEAESEYDSLQKKAAGYNKEIEKINEGVQNGTYLAGQAAEMRDKVWKRAEKETNGAITLDTKTTEGFKLKVVDSANKKIKEIKKNIGKIEETQGEINENIEYATGNVDKFSKGVGGSKKSFKDLNSEAKALKERLKKGGVFSVTAKTDKKYKDTVKEFGNLKDKTVKAIAKAEKTGDYTAVSEAFTKWEKNAKKTLNAYLNGKLDKESTKEVLDTWNSIDDNTKKELRAHLSAEEQGNFDEMVSAFSNIKDVEAKATITGVDNGVGDVIKTFGDAPKGEKKATYTVSVKDGSDGIQKINDKIQKLKEKRIELKAKGDTQGMKNIDNKIAALQKKKIQIQADVSLSQRTKNAAKQVLKTNVPKEMRSFYESLTKLKKGGILKGGKWFPVARYASGGLPTQGQYFMAREAGPELVGTIGNHTAVMNNDQIVASVSDGVFNALNPVLTRVANALARLENMGSSGDISVQIDGKEVFNAVRSQNDSFRRRTGKSGLA